MKTLAIIAQKGGSGKTTLAVHMAVCTALHQRKAAVIDLDPQGNAYNWNESRENGRKLDAVRGNATELAALLHQAETAGIDLAIVDTAPHSNSDAAMTAQLADLNRSARHWYTHTDAQAQVLGCSRKQVYESHAL